jgi:hypothetical protein
MDTTGHKPSRLGRGKAMQPPNCSILSQHARADGNLADPPAIRIIGNRHVQGVSLYRCISTTVSVATWVHFFLQILQVPNAPHGWRYLRSQELSEAKSSFGFAGARPRALADARPVTPPNRLAECLIRCPRQRPRLIAALWLHRHMQGSGLMFVFRVSKSTIGQRKVARFIAVFHTID